MNSIGKEYLTTVIRRLKYYKDLGEKAMEQLDEKEIHYRPNEESNSVAIIVQHMAGNMLSRFTNFLTEDGEKEWRQRDDEFEIHNYTKQQVIELWQKGWQCVFDALEGLKDDDLMKIITIRKETLTVIDAINRQLAHYPHHIGQILYIGKIVKGSSWKNLSIPKGQSQAYNQSNDAKDPAKKY